MLPVMSWKLKEAFSYIMLTLGISLDHISTEIGLRNPNIYETNPLALMLMKNNVWWAFDITLIISFCICTHYIIKVYYPKKQWLVFLPLLTGVFRFSIGIYNILLFMSV